MDGITDPKIRAIMAKLNNAPEAQVGTTDDAKPTVQKPDVKPPLTFEEFLKAEKINEWPQRLTSENLLDLAEERELLGSKDSIYQELKEATPLDMQFLQRLEDRLGALTDRLNHFADQIVVRKPETLLAVEEATEEEEPKREDSPKNQLSNLNRAFLTDMPESELLKVHPSRKGKKTMDFKESLLETKKKGLENCTFPGFRKGELTELPGNLEAPQILNRVTKAQDFNPGFKKFWKKIFQSEASVAVMQDAFWWIFVDNFETKRRDEQDKLYDRIADSFVALFTSIHPEIKDKFFMSYSDCVSQAIFAAYMEAFPESTRIRQDDFKQVIINTVFEWVSGIRPPPSVWKKWDSNRLESKTLKVSEDSQTQAVKNMRDAAALNSQGQVSYSLDIEDFNKMITKLGNPAGASRSATAVQNSRTAADAHKSTPSALLALQVAVPPIPLSRQAQCGTPRREPQERKLSKKKSHTLGPGPELQRVLFNLKGQSPLVTHYLRMHQLQDKKRPGRRVRRTEITKVPKEKQTYKQFIQETQLSSDALRREYQRVCEQTAMEIAKIEKQQRDINRDIDRLQRELTTTRNNPEVKIISERIMDKRENLPDRNALKDVPHEELGDEADVEDDSDY